MKSRGSTANSAAIALAAALGLAATAHATDIDIPGTGFAGIAENGNSGTDAFGQTWRWGTFTVTTGTGINKKTTTYSDWGVPGFGHGDVDDYKGSIAATDFFVSFLTSATNVSISKTSPNTEFMSCNSSGKDCVAWTPVYQPTTDPLEVNFFAPKGTELIKGDEYFVSVAFTNNKLSGKNAGFSAVYSANVPEPATWAMMLLGVAGVGGAMRSARRKHAIAVAG